MAGLIVRPTARGERLSRVCEKLRKDKLQFQFNFNKEKQEIELKENSSKYAVIFEKGFDPYKMTTCPFCLSWHRFNGFLISTKKGIDRGRGKCPICGQGMQLKTLVKMEEWTNTKNPNPKAYAEWVFEYRSSGFWHKVQPHFDAWKKHLKMMGWTQQFWDEYKRLRGDAPDSQREKELEQKWYSYEESFE